MSIIGNAIAGGVGDGMRTYAGQMAAGYQAEDRRSAVVEELKAKRAALLEELAAKAKEGDADRVNKLEIEKLKGRSAAEVEEIKRRSEFASRPDLYGHEKLPGKEEFTQNTPTRTDDSEYSDAVSRRSAPLIDREVYDKEGHSKAVDAAAQKNIDRKTQVDTPQYADDQQRGVGRGIINSLIQRDPQSQDAAAASLAVEGKPRYSQSTGGNTVLDNATGKASITGVGESVIAKNERPPAARVGGGAAGTGANERALVASLRTQASNISKSIDKLSEGYITPQKAEMIREKKAELAGIVSRLGEAERALSKPGAAPQTAPDKRPSLADFLKK